MVAKKSEQLNIWKKMYNKNNLSLPWHYNTIVTSVILYGMKTTARTRMEKLLKIERIILKRVDNIRRTKDISKN